MGPFVSPLERLQQVPRLSFLTLPTPLHRLNALSEMLDADLWIKRDDLTGFALGGNKGRKLQYLLADARAQQADCIVACGAVQSNHARQTAAAARLAGMEPHLVLLGEPEEAANGNPLLERWLDASISFVGGELWRKREPAMWDLLDDALEETANALEAQGKKPYVIPLGGSAPLGALGFVEAVVELGAQLQALELEPFDEIVFASSSGGTHSGLHLGCGLMGWTTRALGICADPEDLRPDIADLCSRASKLLGREQTVLPEEIALTEDYVGEGYAIPTPECVQAIKLLAQKEGIFLDPVYSGKAMAGFLDLIKTGQLEGKRFLFWHTGGLPALFAEEFLSLAQG